MLVKKNFDVNDLQGYSAGVVPYFFFIFAQAVSYIEKVLLC